MHMCWELEGEVVIQANLLENKCGFDNGNETKSSPKQGGIGNASFSKTTAHA